VCWPFVPHTDPTDRRLSSPPQSACSLGSVCGFGGVADGETPNREPSLSTGLLVGLEGQAERVCLIEWFRFILPIFIHVGLVHLLLNMFAQLTIGGQVEREMGRSAPLD
jgi:membrane associated rhomboid family serine protease